MKNKLAQVLSIVALSMSAVVISVNSASAATTVSLQKWHLVDSGRHLDWDGSTKYQSYFNTAVTRWNNYKSGVIRKDTASTIQDVKISDYSESSSTGAYTSTGVVVGAIRFNTKVMDNISPDEKQNVTIHELGHALGLDHNTSSDVMYKYISRITNLSSNDKASYDAAYKKY